VSRRAWDVLASVVTNTGISCQKVGLAGQGSSHVVTQPRSRATRLTPTSVLAKRPLTSKTAIPASPF
jgi:hypothetical protein